MTDEATRLALADKFEHQAKTGYRPEVFGESDRTSGPFVSRSECLQIVAALRAIPREPIAQGQREALEQFSSNAPLMVSLRGYLHWRHQGLENSLETAIAKADAALAPSAQGRQYDRSNIHR